MPPDEPERPDDEDEPVRTEPAAADTVAAAPVADEAVHAAEPPPKDEPRAKDLIGRTREELEDELDPRTMAELAGWFARPSRVEVEEAAGSKKGGRDDHAIAQLDAAMGMLVIEESEEQKQARAAALAAVDPRMLDLLERHEREAGSLLPIRPEVTLHLDETVVPAWIRASLASDGTDLPAIGEPRTIQRTPDIDALLDNDNAPQAVLRDLYRPEETFERRMERTFAEPPAEEDRAHAIREALRWRPEPLPPPWRLPDYREDWRPLLEGAWGELVPAARDARQAEADAAAADDPGFALMMFRQG